MRNLADTHFFNDLKVSAEDSFHPMGLQNHLPSEATRRFVKPCMDVKLGQCSYNPFALQESSEKQIRTRMSPQMVFPEIYRRETPQNRPPIEADFHKYEGQILRGERNALPRNNWANCDVKEAAGRKLTAPASRFLTTPNDSVANTYNLSSLLANKQNMASSMSTMPKRYDELKKYNGTAAEPRSIKEEGWSTTLIPTTEDFWRNKQNKKEIYPVTKNNYRNRVALLITNIKFTLEKLDRHGAEKDEENAEKLLTDLGYEVVKYTNLTAKAIDEAVIKFSKHPKLRETDSVMVVIMSHGELGTIQGVETSKLEPDEFPIDNIYKHLGPKKCPALLNKTKILIIQACRGGEEGSVLMSDCAAVPYQIRLHGFSPEDLEDDSCQRYEHREKDFISLLSCTPGTVAYRHLRLGSFLIRFIVKVFNTAAYEDDIEELFRKVMQRFEEFCPSNKRQMATKDRCTLTKRFYFYPGLNVV
ncbi:unnamed protein product [Pleuronectes platessa]|uniref:Caspase-1 n=1 Tax=Pleuronectes platessa TaxID=8262 RepID=A0A9N7VWP3_PLEPL|nr:unnamed protein product [Pleuronectes platessa]